LTGEILFVTPRFTPYVGGVEYVVKSMAAGLVSRGYNVTVLSGDPLIKKVKSKVIDNIKVIRWPTWTINSAYHVPKNIQALQIILKYLSKKADVVHIHGAHAFLPVFIGIRIKKMAPNTKLIFTPHYHGKGHTFLREVIWWAYWRNKVNDLIRMSDIVHSVSREEAKKIISHFKDINKKIVIIPNGVPDDVFDYVWKGKHSNYIIYAGRVERYKNLDKSINIAKIMKMKLIIIGDGSYKKGLKRYAQKVYSNRVIFLPHVERSKYLKLLKSARYAINISNYEAFSLFIAEALAMRVPVIISRSIAKIYGLDFVDNIRRDRIDKKLYSYLLKNDILLLDKVKSNIKIKKWTEIIDKLIKNVYRI